MGLGSLEIYRNRLDEAASTVLGASDIAKKIGWEQGVGIALLRLGSIRRRQGSYSEGEEFLRESTSVFRHCKVRWRLAQGLYGLGVCLHAQGRLDEAAAALEESCSLYLEISVDDWEFPPTARALAKVKKDLGRASESLRWYDAAIAEHHRLQLEDKNGLSVCLADKARILNELKQYDEAALHFEASLVLSQELGDDQGVKRDQLLLQGMPKTAISWESRNFAKPRPISALQASHLLCDVKKLQRRIPQLRTSCLKLEIGVTES
ncbi:hypothetical protein M407DRAFT_125543 [Tulasnella calospora MUT 4182]|uniref:MalT-like TPR region domain-containing protein n=1 Tax=Tulasnella calospora MUT 4182 TaxID=1051891 RepID=A0A0C3Q0K9_9AGAM|nr:hypothetical protein M407DRAFT_125543 [Tulasnella calospora MUT 4182]